MTFTLTAVADSKRLLFENGDRHCELHPIWVRERTTEPGTVDEGSLQRLFTPTSIDPDVHAVGIAGDVEQTTVTWSDGHVQRVDHQKLAIDLGWLADPTAPPTAEPWASEPEAFPRLPWPTDDEAILEALSAFWRLGFVVLTDTPTTPGSLLDLAGSFGVVRPTNFGTLFDVFSKPNPVDLAYTPRELTAHTDNPYRRPVPGIQFLHCLENDAQGGESTLVDGLSAFGDLREIDAPGHEALCSIPVTYRYQFGDERLADRSPILETYATGEFAGIRNSDRLDFVDAVDPDELDTFYSGRAGLRNLLNDPARRATFLLAKGDLMMMDNRRLLHGRLSYSLESGSRHLQGCYIEHDGPELLWRKLSLAGTSAQNPPLAPFGN